MKENKQLLFCFLSCLIVFGLSQTCNSLPSSLLAWYRLDGNWLDSSTNGRHGYNVANATRPPSFNSTFSVNGSALVLNGTHGSFRVDNFPLKISSPEKVTICFWMLSTQSSAQTVLQYQDLKSISFDPELAGVTFSNMSTSPLISFQSIVANLSLSPTNYLGDGKWHHVCSILDTEYPTVITQPDGKQVTDYVPKLLVFVDGNVTFISGSKKFLLVFPAGNLLFGFDWLLQSNYLGMLDEVLIFSRSLSPTEISILASTQLFCCGLSSSNPLVCSTHGLCNYPDNCTCFNSTMWTGLNCEIPVCFSNPATSTRTCNGNGICSAPDTCICHAGFKGANCEFTMCANPTTNATCSDRGVCVDNSCRCNSMCHVGAVCELDICKPISSIQISRDANYRLAGNHQNNYTVNFVLGMDIPLYLQNLVSCASRNYSFPTTPAVQVEGNRMYSCLLNFPIPGIFDIFLQLNNTRITNNSLPFVALNDGFLSFHNSSLAVTHLEALNLSVYFVLSEPVPDNRFVFCQSEEVEKYPGGMMLKEYFTPALPVITTDNTTFMCNFAANNQSRRIPFMAVFNNSIPVKLSSVRIVGGFFEYISQITNDPILSVGGCIANYSCLIQLIPSIGYTKISPWLRLSLQERLFKVFAGTKSFFSAPMYHTPGLFNISLWVQLYALQPQLTRFAPNDIPFGIFDSAIITSFFPFASFLGTNHTVNLTLQSPLTVFNSSVNVTYVCGWQVEDGSKNSFIYSTLNKFNDTFMSCDIYSPPIQQTLKLKIYAFVSWHPAPIVVTPLGYEGLFDYWERKNFTTLTPFIAIYNGIEKSVNAAIFTDSPVISDHGLYCTYMSSDSILMRTKASLIDSTSVNCTIDRTAIVPGSTDVTDVGMRVYLTDSNYLDLIIRNVSLTLIPGPIRLITETIVGDDPGTQVPLNFISPPPKSQLKFSIEVSFVNLGLKNQSVTLNCTFPQNQFFSCVLPASLPVIYIPLPVSFFLQVNQTNNPIPIVLPMNSALYKENVTFVSEYPFIGDASTTNNNLTNFVLDKNVNPNYSYHCMITRVTTGQVIMNPASFLSSKSFNCSLTSPIEQLLKINIQVTTDIMVPFVMSTNGTSIQFGFLELYPPIVEMTENSTHVLMFRDSRRTDIIPTKYSNSHHKYDIQLFSSSGIGKSMPCIIEANGNSTYKTATCSRMAITPKSFISNDIQNITAIVMANGVLSTISHPFILYTRGTVSSIIPAAILRNQSVSVAVNFNTSTLSVGQSIHVQFFCKTNQTGDMEFSSFAENSLTQSCYLNSSATSIGNILNIATFARFPQADPTLIATLSNEHSVLVRIVDTGLLSFVDPLQVIFFYSGTKNIVPVNFTSDLPTDDIMNNVKCRLVSLTNQWTYQETILGAGTDKNKKFNQFNCTLTTLSPGLNNLSLWYHDSRNEFQYSSNSLSLVFATRSGIVSIDPFAVRTNKTVNLAVVTQFNSLINYGTDIQFFCNYTAINLVSNSSMATIATNQNGVFYCNLTSFQPGPVSISITMVIAKTELTITTEPVVINILDSFFLEPSYGLITGGETVIVRDFDLQETNVQIGNQIDFTCNKSGSILNCTTPPISSFLPFQNYNVSIGATTLAVQFVLYEMRTITSLWPSVISTQEAVINNVTISLDKPLTTISGTISFSIAEYTTDTKRYDIGSVSNSNNFALNITGMPEGNLPVTMFYKNSNLLTVRRSVLIATNTPSIMFISPRVASFASGTSNIGPWDSIFNVTVQLSGTILPADIAMNVYCITSEPLQGTPFIFPTFVHPTLSNTFICSVNNSMVGIMQLKLVYISPKAYKGQFDLVSNNVTVIFMEQVSITNISPFISLNEQAPVVITIDKTDVYGSTVVYKCLYSDSGIIPATRIGNTISCTLSRKIEHKTIQVSLQIAGAETNGIYIPFSFYPINFVFSNLLQIDSLDPFAVGFTSSPTTVTTTITTNLVILIYTGLYCKYTTDDGTISLVHTEVKGNTVKCTVTQTKFTNTTSILPITLWVNDSINSYSISLNQANLIFINETSLRFIDSTTFFATDFQRSNITRELNFVAPSLPYEILYNVRIGDTKLLSCQFPHCILEDPPTNNFPRSASIYLVIKSQGKTNSIPIQPYFVLDTVSLSSVCPYVFGVGESVLHPKRLEFVTERPLNFESMKYLSCEVKGITSGLSYLTPVIPFGEYVNKGACMITSLGIAETATISLHFMSIGNISTNGSIVFVNSLPASGLQRGPMNGGTPINVTLPIPIEDARLFIPSLQVIDQTFSLPMNQCIVSPDLSSISCVTPSSTVARYVRISLFINKLLAMQVLPFRYYPETIITSVIPSIVDPRAKISFVILQGSFQHFIDQIKWIQYFSPAFNYSSPLFTCTDDLANSNQLFCPISIFPTLLTGPLSFVLTHQPDSYSVSYSNLITLIENPQPIVISIFPTSATIGTQVDVVISGFYLIQSNFTSATVWYSDQYLNIPVPALVINDHTIQTKTPLFYEEKSTYPRSLQISIQFGTALVIATNLSITFNSFTPVTIIPALVPLGSAFSNIKLLNFPNITLKAQHSSLFVQLVDLQTNSVTLQCSNQYFTCASIQTFPRSQMAMALLVSVKDSSGTIVASIPSIRLNSPLQVVSTPTIIDLSPKRVFKGITNIIITGDNIPAKYANTLLIQYIPISSTRINSAPIIQSASIIQTVSSQQSVTLSVDAIPQIIGSWQVANISFNDGYNWIPTSIAIVVSKPIQSIVLENVEDDNQPTGFTFKHAFARIVGDNFPNALPSIRLFFRIGLLSSVTTVFNATQLDMNYESERSISFNFPIISELLSYSKLSLLSSIQYPFDGVEMSVSFNEGADRIPVNVVYLNKYRAPLLVTSDLKILPRQESVDLVVRGNYFKNLTECVLSFAGNNISLAIITSDDQFSAICKIPNNTIPIGVSKALISIRNRAGELSSEITLLFYSVPILTSIQPSNCKSTGGMTVKLFAQSLDLPHATLYIQMGRIGNLDPCTFESQDADMTILSCLISAHQVGTSNARVTYNMNHIHGTQLSFTFLGCPPGHSAKYFDQQCTPCPPGFYKQIGEFTNGTVDCFECEVGQYASTYASLRCTDCPLYSTTLGRNSSVISDCGCLKGYMINPYLDKVKSEDLNKFYCIKCPIGANCTTFNTTDPRASYGYWFSSSNLTNFDVCLPAEACPGGNAETCAEGFFGDRCGKCRTHYWKSKGRCTRCTGDAPWRFVLLVLIVIALALLFFAFSSIKMRHVTSISIAVSFTQVISLFAKLPAIKFPSTMDNSVSVFTVSNFNYDFISLECVLPISYEVKWALSLSLPYVLFIIFLMVYIGFELRSCFAAIISRCVHSKYWPSYKSDKSTGKLKSLAHKIGNKVLITPRNFVIWLFAKPSTRLEMQAVRDKIINAFCTFVSFVYTFIMTESSEVFNCTRQANGKRSLNPSPDIYCYESRSWFVMMPIAIVNIVIVNACVLILYVYIFWFRYNLKEKNTPFRNRFKFILQRFRSKYYYWDALVTFRKTLMSILFVMLQPMNVIVVSLAIIFVGIILQHRCVPYKKKWHNLMDYFILIATLIVLFCGLLFYVDSFPSDGWRTTCQTLAMVTIIGAVVFIAALILWDILVRRGKETTKTFEKKMMTKQQQQQQQEEEKLAQHGTDTDDIVFVHPFTVDDVESDEDKSNDLNQIIWEVFSLRRAKKNLMLLNKKSKQFFTWMFVKLKRKKKEASSEPNV